jgi:hypothetical protein
MSAFYPLSFFLLTGVIWIIFIVRAHQLFYRFRSKYPDSARKEIPHAFEFYGHPEKIRYFFRGKSVELLKSDPEIWKLREQVRYLFYLSVAFPVVGFIALAVMAFVFYGQ